MLHTWHDNEMEWFVRTPMNSPGFKITRNVLCRKVRDPGDARHVHFDELVGLIPRWKKQWTVVSNRARGRMDYQCEDARRKLQSSLDWHLVLSAWLMSDVYCTGFQTFRPLPLKDHLYTRNYNEPFWIANSESQVLWNRLLLESCTKEELTHSTFEAIGVLAYGTSGAWAMETLVIIYSDIYSNLNFWEVGFGS